MEVISTLPAVVTSIGSRGVLGQETPCTVSVYQGSSFVADQDVHLEEPVILERLAIDVRRD